MLSYDCIVQGFGEQKPGLRRGSGQFHGQCGVVKGGVGGQPFLSEELTVRRENSTRNGESGLAVVGN